MRLFWYLLMHALRDGGLVGVARFVVGDNPRAALHWLALLLLAVAATGFEAVFRQTSPYQYLSALFWPAPLLMIGALYGLRWAIPLGAVIGITAGIVARENAAWFTYIAPNVLQAVLFCLLARRWTFELQHPLARFAMRLLAMTLAIALAAAVGVLLFVLTERYYYGAASPVPAWYYFAHWFCGDWKLTFVALVMLSAVEEHGTERRSTAK